MKFLLVFIIGMTCGFVFCGLGNNNKDNKQQLIEDAKMEGYNPPTQEVDCADYAIEIKPEPPKSEEYIVWEKRYIECLDAGGECESIWDERPDEPHAFLYGNRLINPCEEATTSSTGGTANQSGVPAD